MIKDEQKWYIEDFDGMDNFIIKNKLLEIDYQRLLNIIKFKNLEYKIVDECPANKPFIIYKTRQCVSSCSSSNLIEFGIFMTEPLYLYNNICYNECPYGSINDNITFTCKEKNEYTKADITLTKEYYNKIQEDSRNRYLGDEYAKETVECIRAPDMSIIHHKASNNTDDNEKIEKFKEKKIPIFIFPECLNILRNKYNLNESENIYLEIIENNDIKSTINSTSFKFFKENGEIIDHSCCFNSTIEVMKYVDTTKTNITFIEYVLKLNESLNILDLSEINVTDRCQPLSIDGKDWTGKDIQSILNKTEKICGPNCSFVSFDFDKNYSYCTCKFVEENENNKIDEELLEDLFGNEFMERVLKIFEGGNFHYFYCIKKVPIYELKRNHVMYFGIFILITEIILFVMYFSCCDCYNSKSNYISSNNVIINQLRNASKFEILEKEKDLILSEDNTYDDEIIDEFDIARAKYKKICFCKNFCVFLKQYFKEKIIFFIFCHKDEFDTFIIKLIKIIIFVQNYYFICGFLFTEKYISSRRFIKTNQFEYAFTTEKQRVCLIVFTCSVMNIVLFYFFNISARLEDAKKKYERVKNLKSYTDRIKFLIKAFPIKMIIGTIFIIVLHFAFLLFNIIFFSIHSHSLFAFYVYLILSLVGYFILYCFAILIVAFLRTVSLVNKNFFFELIFIFSLWLGDYL